MYSTVQHSTLEGIVWPYLYAGSIKYFLLLGSNKASTTGIVKKASLTGNLGARRGALRVSRRRPRRRPRGLRSDEVLEE